MFQEEYAGLTTAMLTRRISTEESVENRLTFWEIDEMLNGGGVRDKVRECLDYQLKQKRGFDFEWVGVTTVYRRTGTPVEFIFLWIDDPENEISTDHLAPALDKHIEGCEFASEEGHKYNEEGKGGVIVIEYEPVLVDHLPEKFSEIREESETEPRPITRSAQFVAGQLVHLPVGDYMNSNDQNPRATKIRGAALAWASPYNWFRASGGIPEL
jgi:hypothetical protein